MDEAYAFYKASSGQWARACKEACGFRLEILSDDEPSEFLLTAFCQDLKEATLRLSAAGYVPFRTLHGLDGELAGVLEGDVIRLNTGEQYRVEDGFVLRSAGVGKEDRVGRICDRVIYRTDGLILFILDVVK